MLQFFSLPDYCFEDIVVPAWAFDKRLSPLYSLPGAGGSNAAPARTRPSADGPMRLPGGDVPGYDLMFTSRGPPVPPLEPDAGAPDPDPDAEDARDRLATYARPRGPGGSWGEVPDEEAAPAPVLPCLSGDCAISIGEENSTVGDDNEPTVSVMDAIDGGEPATTGTNSTRTSPDRDVDDAVFAGIDASVSCFVNQLDSNSLGSLSPKRAGVGGITTSSAAAGEHASRRCIPMLPVDGSVVVDLEEIVRDLTRCDAAMAPPGEATATRLDNALPERWSDALQV